MELKTINLIFLSIFSLILISCAATPVTINVVPEKPKPNIFDKAENFKIDFKKKDLAFKIPAGTKIDTIIVDSLKKSVKIELNSNFAFLPFREDNVKEIYSDVKNYFGDDFSNYKYSVTTIHLPIEDLIPNYFRKDSAEYDRNRLPIKIEARPAPVVQNIDKKYIPTNGLFNRNIVVWPSHGWYYANREDRWEWQRPRIFQSVEDLVPLSFVVPYLLPMLENAGAIVFDPRERDIQSNCVVVDNDSQLDLKSKYYIEKGKDKKHPWKNGDSAGFAVGNPPYPNDYNPFSKGTYRIIETDTTATASISWIPNIPEEGYYAVYVSYNASDKNIPDARYTVYHEGIQTEFKVNQQIGGSTWIYLGEFKFANGYNPKTDKVVLTNQSSEAGKIVSADAIRFGGGMGIIERGGAASGRPKIFEGARYYLQYAGMPDSLVYDLNNGKNDYNDDYQSRPEYVNYLTGKPFGPNRDRNAKGLGIPIDLSLAFHTDAGITHNDTTVGTLSIYSIPDAQRKSVFPDGMSRLANRDFADILQTQIVNDIHAEFDPAWNRRQLDNANYSESRNQNVPSVLVEMLSHQNFLDMKFVHDPQFKFDVARAIYKGMLRFLSTQYHFDYVVEPLPVTNFTTSLDENGNVTLTWKPKADLLEPTAMPDKYIVYTRIDDGDFDNGIVVDQPKTVFNNVKPGVIFSYKVTAINKGGESFPSEILSVCRMDNNKKPVLIVNGFYRIAGPATIETPKFIGFFNQKDPGIPDKYGLSFTGSEYDFDSTHEWISNDNPGWGASRADYEAKVIAGNTFDYPYVHGLSIKEAGYPFVSVSAQAVEDSEVTLKNYKLVDLILGEQKTTHWERAKEDSIEGLRFQVFPKKLKSEIESYCKSGGNIFVSGSYVGSDLFAQPKLDSVNINFAEKVLHYKFDTDHAAVTGEVFSADSLFMPKFENFNFNSKLNDKVYAVTAPDAIEHVKDSKTIMRYSENQFSAATACKGNYGVIVFGFPFETILEQQARNEVMKAVLGYFGM